MIYLSTGEFRKLFGQFLLARTNLMIAIDRIEAAVKNQKRCEKAVQKSIKVNGTCSPKTLLARDLKLANAKYERAFERKSSSIDEFAEAEKNLFDFFKKSFNIAEDATMDVYQDIIRVRSVAEDEGEGEPDKRFINYDISTKGDLRSIYSP